MGEMPPLSGGGRCGWMPRPYVGEWGVNTQEI